MEQERYLRESGVNDALDYALGQLLERYRVRNPRAMAAARAASRVGERDEGDDEDDDGDEEEEEDIGGAAGRDKSGAMEAESEVSSEAEEEDDDDDDDDDDEEGAKAKARRAAAKAASEPLRQLAELLREFQVHGGAPPPPAPHASREASPRASVSEQEPALPNDAPATTGADANSDEPQAPPEADETGTTSTSVDAEG